jgi:hypothetical protein
MTAARRRALLIAAVALFLVAAFAFAQVRRSAPLSSRPSKVRPTLLLLTSLPLVFSEDFSLQGGSPALKRLQARYSVMPISVTDTSNLARGLLLLMAQPQAQTAENLVALDDWVRRGGRVLLLADPMLEWPSKRPLGDPLRPPAMFGDTGLLAHWGLRLDAPDHRGPATRRLGSETVATASPGTLQGNCAVSRDGLVAHCKVGKGEATIIADADLLNGGDQNLDGLLEVLAELESG